MNEGMINCGLTVRHGEFAGKFRSSLFKGLSEPPRSAVALRRGRNNLILPKRHRRVNAEQCSAEGNRTSGGFPFLYKQFIIVCPLFSLMQEAQMKTASLRSARGRKRRPALGKKEHAAKGVSRLRARPTLRALDLRSLFEKNLRKPLAVYSVSLLRKHQRRKNFPASSPWRTDKLLFIVKCQRNLLILRDIPLSAEYRRRGHFSYTFRAR